MHRPDIQLNTGISNHDDAYLRAKSWQMYFKLSKSVDRFADILGQQDMASWGGGNTKDHDVFSKVGWNSRTFRNYFSPFNNHQWNIEENTISKICCKVLHLPIEYVHHV